MRTIFTHVLPLSHAFSCVLLLAALGFGAVAFPVVPAVAVTVDESNSELQTTNSEPVTASQSEVRSSTSITIAPHARLLIPRIHVDAVIENMGLTPGGAMAVPDSAVTVGWFGLGTRPGDVGSAVIGGHNVWDGTAGAFARLEELTVGDVLTVVDADGIAMTFIVRTTQTVNADADATEIFTSQSGAHLNVITCSGTWNPVTQSLAQRFVVFADLVTSIAP